MPMSSPLHDPFEARSTLETRSGAVAMYRLAALEEAGKVRLEDLPYSIRVLLEAVLRHCDGFQVTAEDVERLAGWNPDMEPAELPFKPARVILQDFTGVPAVVDLAAMRNAMQRLGGDPSKINPLIPVDLVIDHSIQTDYFGTDQALKRNVELEFDRNRERYALLNWAQKAFDNFRAVPPSVGIIHQVNLEYLAQVVRVGEDAQGPVAFPDTLVGTDSHTVMINGTGVLGWGVGGIEAEAVMLGQPYYMLAPQVVGLELTGKLAPGVTATDLVLTVVELLRKEGVVGKFVEYFGSGVDTMPVVDRAVLANMGPEYGATMGFFPIDHRTLEFLRETGRSEDQVDLVERYAKEQSLFRSSEAGVPKYTKVLSLDLGSVEPSLAGPKRPQDRLPLSQMKEAFRKTLVAPTDQQGFALSEAEKEKTVEVELEGETASLGHGTVAIASITSCTNTSNPGLMLTAGLIAKKAVEKGLRRKPWVKTSLAPGSRVVTDYLEKAGLTPALDALGFQTVGYGCLTCIGNSGPLPEPVAEAIKNGDLVATSVLSGNRNFEGRINPLVKANYLASPPLVIAYALAGTLNHDLLREPLGQDTEGNALFLKDLWPSDEEIEKTVAGAIDPEMYRRRYADVYSSSEMWNAIATEASELFAWDPDSTYVQEPPFLKEMEWTAENPPEIRGARVLVALGDSVTTDHISPAGAIAPDGPAGRYLQQHGVPPEEFNSFGSRRGNDRVMTRGTFANIRIRNLLAPGTEGGVTRHLPDGETMSVFDAAMKYREEGVPLVVLAGKEYGTGSSRDWAAKGTSLLGVRAVLAESYERIHRGNLVGMGVLPLEFTAGDSWKSLGLTGEEVFDIEPLGEDFRIGDRISVTATSPEGKQVAFQANIRIDTPVELTYYRNGGILQAVLRKLAN
jgi:aconitate hydratase